MGAVPGAKTMRPANRATAATAPSDDRSDVGAFHPSLSHATHIPIVEVGAETGQVTLLKRYVVSDRGTVMNPTRV